MSQVPRTLTFITLSHTSVSISGHRWVTYARRNSAIIYQTIQTTKCRRCRFHTSPHSRGRLNQVPQTQRQWHWQSPAFFFENICDQNTSACADHGLGKRSSKTSRCTRDYYSLAFQRDGAGHINLRLSTDLSRLQLPVYDYLCGSSR